MKLYVSLVGGGNELLTLIFLCIDNKALTLHVVRRFWMFPYVDRIVWHLCEKNRQGFCLQGIFNLLEKRVPTCEDSYKRVSTR